MERKTVAIILAGGEGVRMDADCPKQFLPLAGRPVIAHSLAAFERSGCVTDIVAVCHSAYIDRLKGIIEEYGMKKVRTVVAGGRTRQESSLIGVKNCPTGTEYVVIHDAVRPLVGMNTIERTVEAAAKKGAAASAVKAADTIVEVADGCIIGIPSRDTMMRVQTPQGFRYDLILEA
ncbi:MAG: 2-C-methyl-D-erythritol 4-phosphate cytidylyltransferase, partial [Candidatus Omnitrophica bacterium]|nr:2-C-methyl-D-erythritol 4-phosphate cytidylyltransferase [Candidatus Omnitrophota bacterium]